MDETSPAAAPSGVSRFWLKAAFFALLAVAALVMFTGRTRPAALVVIATDGDATQAWIERDGQPAQPLALDNAELAPGPIAVRVVRTTANKARRSDIVWLTLHAGFRHLVAVGDAPLLTRAEAAGRNREVPARYIPPGRVRVDSQGWHPIADESAAAGQVPTHPSVGLSSMPTPERAGDHWLTAQDRVLLLINPYAEAMECRVEGDGWKHALALPGPVCRVMPIGT